jgi:hypothetical protein
LYIFPQGRPYRATWYDRTVFRIASWCIHDSDIDPDEWLAFNLADEYVESTVIDGVQAFYRHIVNRTMHPYAKTARYSFIYGGRYFTVTLESGDGCVEEWAAMQDILETIRLQRDDTQPPTTINEPAPIINEPTTEEYVSIENWQEAYAELLRWYATQPPPHNLSYLSWGFILYDIDKDGIPELIITYMAAGIWGESLYTFVDDEVRSLEFRDAVFAYYTILARQDNQAGIIISAYGLVTLMQIDETGMFAEVRLQSPFMPCDDIKWFIDDIEVTEEEHNTMLESLIPFWPQWDDPSVLWPHNVTEDNIQSVILQASH